ncbi:hypothetical protein GE061_001183 [Apolygus lucorum]|uniref:ethanolamine kinase n=1 Tax=Apolygus lucorum TaxID=248454 RepID=A0A6A4KMY1_APOLU|nr:hypothetical protein GE061_001183 [Apolygus lucorum]
MEEVPHLDVTVVEGDFKTGGLKILRSVRPEWSPSEVVFKVFTDGITNTLFGCSIESNPSDMVLIRSYGKNTELLIDRKAETKNFKILHQWGYAPMLYATFNNGLAYEFMPGVTLDENTVKDPAIFPLVAAMLARFHAIPIESEKRPILWPKLRKYLSLIPSSYKQPTKRTRFEQLFPNGRQSLENEINYLQQNLEDVDLKVVFCHNDLLLSNIIHSDGKVHFIDYEYADCNYQAFDIGNHFTEFAGVNNINFSRIPDKDFQVRWLKLYLKELRICTGDQTEITQEEVAGLYEKVNKFILVGHIFWITWALVQAEISELDFDFIEYASLKMGDYYSRKPAILP